jgi:cytochrome c5
MGRHDVFASFATRFALLRMTKVGDRNKPRHGEERLSGRVANHARHVGALAAALAVTACGAPPPPALTPEQVMALTPADTRLAGLYETSCKACHAMPGNLAPQVRDRAAWDPRWKQGETVLLDHTIQGFNAMPAGGQCASCTPDDFKALIRFMAGREDSAK